MKKLLFLLLFLFPACKTTRQLEVSQESGKWNETETLLSHFSGFIFTDSLRYKLSQEIAGQIRVWSPPDNAGNQYPTIDIHFTRKSEEEKQQNPSLIRMDSTTIFEKTHEKQQENSHIKEQQQTDSRIINSNTISWGILLLFITLITLRVIKR